MRSELLKLQRRLFRQKFAALPVFLVTFFRNSPLDERNVASNYARVKAVDSFLQQYGLVLACLMILFVGLVAAYIAIEITYGFGIFVQMIVKFVEFWLMHFLTLF